MRNLKSVLVLSAACILALPGCPEDEEPVTKVEVCNNNVDDDGDSKADCADTDCAAATNCQAKQEICNNTIDDDADGKFDCDDPDCDAEAFCTNKCQAGQTVCGTTCCNAGKICNAANSTCEDPPQCQAGQTECGSNCCNAGEVCNAALSTCETAVTCDSASETLCGNDCCANGTESCKDNVCVGSTVEGCLIPSTFGTVTVTGTVDTGNVPTLVGNLPATEGTDKIMIELFPGSGVFKNGLFSGEVALTADDYDYGSCGFCVRLKGDVAADGETAAADYFLTSAGTVTLASYEETLTATVADAKFTHVTYDDDWFITEHADGCTTTIDTAAFNGDFPPEAEGCDPLAPTCAEGQGCYIANNTIAYCLEAGSIAIGQACTGFGTCVPGAECLLGTCHTWCVPGSETEGCDAGLECKSIISNNSIGMCFKPAVACEPLNPTACGEGEGCYYDGEGYSCATAGTIPVDGACGAEVEGYCEPGAECMEPGVCMEVCGTAADCTNTAATCSTFDEEAGLGVCVVVEICDDAAGDDEDGDGATNCDDTDCALDEACLGTACNPLTPTACTVANESCYYVKDAGFYCRPVGTVAVNQACTGFGQCAAGLECLEGFCHEFCDPKAATSTCEATERCKSVTSSGNIGACFLFEVCDDAASADEDLDGAKNCADTDCATFPACLAPTCATAIAAPASPFDAANTTNGTQTMSGSCGGEDGKEVIYKLSAGTSDKTGYLTIKVTTAFDAIVYARTSCTDATEAGELGCADSMGAGNTTTPMKTETLEINPYVGGTEIALIIDAYAAAGVGVAKVEYTFTVPAEAAVPWVGPTMDGSVKSNETDWYKVDIAEAGSFTAEIVDGATSTCAAEEIGGYLGLYNVDGTAIVELGDYCPTLHIPNLNAGSYLVKFKAAEGMDEFDYKLKITLGAVEACTVTADYGTVTGANGTAAPMYNWIFLAGVSGDFEINSSTPADVLNVELWDGYGVFEDGIVAGDYVLADGELSTETCGLCLKITEGNGKTYFPTGGSVKLTSVEGRLTGSLTNVTFKEGISGSFVPNACSTQVTSGSFDAEIVEPPAE